MSKDGMFDDYYKANQKMIENKNKLTEMQQKQSLNITKDGNWTPSEKQHISNALQMALENFPGNLQQQAKFIQFQLQTYLGIRIQILIYSFKASQGHCLNAIDGKYIQIQCQEYIYVIWKVRLIEDMPHLNHF